MAIVDLGSTLMCLPIHQKDFNRGQHTCSKLIRDGEYYRYSLLLIYTHSFAQWVMYTLPNKFEPGKKIGTSAIIFSLFKFMFGSWTLCEIRKVRSIMLTP